MRLTLTNKLLHLNRQTKQLIKILVDSILVVIGLLSAFSIRLGYWIWPQAEIQYVVESWIILLSPVIAIPIFISFGLYRSIIRYIGFKSIWTIIQAVTLYAVIWGLITYMIELPGIPRSAILINWMIALIFIAGWRILARWYLVNDIEKKKKKKVIIYGAGSAGRQLSTTINTSSEFVLVGFVDDYELIQGHLINGVKVSPPSIIEGLVENNKIDEILLAMPSISRSRRNEIITILSQMLIPVRSMPNLIELAQGNVKVEDLREIDINDLLGRDSIPADKKLLNLRVSGKVVLVTGAGGSIGSELCRQLLLLKPKRLILYDINEYSLYQIHFELEGINSKVEFFPILGSVRDRHRLSQLCQYFDVQTIYHAAAYKHVPLVEHNNSEGVLNNIIGTLVTAEVAIENKVETFVFVSTDKAVRPTSTMGATKRVAELVLQALAKKKHDTCFTMVRFGNVLDSSGSVIPLFKKQIKSGGPVTVTDINIVRYFMTITEAIELVIQAGAMSNGGDVFVLDMGKPIRIDDLARKMIELSGLTVLDKDRPDGDIEIQYTGLRPGEKLYEELLVNEKANKTDSPLIMSTEEAMLDWEELEPILEQLKVASKSSDHFMIRELLLNLVPFFPLISDHIYTIEFLDSGQRIDFSNPNVHHLLRWGSYMFPYFFSLFAGGFSFDLITITSGVSFFIAISILSLVCLREIGFFPALFFLLFIFTSKALNIEVFSLTVVNQALLPLSLLVFLICELTKNPNLKLGPIYMAFLCFWLYGVKETNLFFFPFLLFLNFFFSIKSFYLKTILTFVSLLILETFMLYIFSENNYPFGRVMGLMSSSNELIHRVISENTQEKLTSLGSIENSLKMFYRWYSARDWDTTIIYFSFILSILFLFGRNERLFPKIISSLILSFFFFTTFFIISIFPIVIGQHLITRYLTILLPLSYLIICFGIKELILNTNNKFLAFSFFSLILLTFMSKPVYQLIFIDGEWGYLSLKSHYSYSVKDRREQLENFYEVLADADCVQLISENHELHNSKALKHGTHVDLLLETEHIWLGSEKNDLASRLELENFYTRGGSLWTRKDDLFMRNKTDLCESKIFLRDNGFSLSK